VPDDVLAQLPVNGGVCMVTFVPHFVSPPIAAARLELAALERSWLDENGGDPTAVAPLVARWRSEHPLPPATLAQVADHVEHVREIAGAEHVGIGGDFDGTDELPEGLGDVSTYPALFDELRRRGWRDDELRALAGGNVLRVLRDAEQVAAAT
jgi:membrane dipeptidase